MLFASTRAAAGVYNSDATISPVPVSDTRSSAAISHWQLSQVEPPPAAGAWSCARRALV
jgi:hypothetical protein